MAISSPLAIQVPTAFAALMVSEQALAEPDAVQLELAAPATMPYPGHEPRDLMGVALAAKRLGVHENTIRNWTDRGVLRAVRLPSGHRRIEPAEVARLEAGMLRLGDDDSNEEEARRPRLRGRLRRGSDGSWW